VLEPIATALHLTRFAASTEKKERGEALIKRTVSPTIYLKLVLDTGNRYGIPARREREKEYDAKRRKGKKQSRFLR